MTQPIPDSPPLTLPAGRGSRLSELLRESCEALLRRWEARCAAGRGGPEAGRALLALMAELVELAASPDAVERYARGRLEEIGLGAALGEVRCLRRLVRACWRARWPGQPVPPSLSRAGDQLIDALAAVAERRARESRARVRELELLDDASRRLSESLDVRPVAETIAKLFSEALADWCIVFRLEVSGRLEALGAAHSHPGREERLTAMARQYPPRLQRESAWYQALEEGHPLRVPVTEDELAARAHDREHLELLRGLGLGEWLLLPLSAQGRPMGALLLGCAERRLGPEALALAERLAARAGPALDNALRYDGARRAARARDEVLGAVAHDLRNPLAVIRLSVDVLRRRLSEGERRQLAPITRAAERMGRLISDLIDVAALEAGQLALKLERHSPPQLLGDAYELAQAMARDSGIDLRVDIESPLAEVEADRDRILQVFSNLLGNALKFTPRGGRVLVGARQVGEEVRFRVSDTGRGIPSWQLSRLFGRFWQANRGDRRGAGLGLTIAQGIIEAHGGHIWVESEVGRGTTVHFSLPASPADRTGAAFGGMPGLH